MSGKSPVADRESGFTLLEVLVGLLISALILVAASMAMKTINLSYDRTTQSLGRQSVLESGLDIVAGDLSRLERAFDNAAKPTRFLFSGRAGEMIYVLAERPGNNSGGIYWVRLQVRNSAAGNDLVRERAAMQLGDSDPGQAKWVDAVTLLSGDYTIAFAYRSTRAGLRDWADTWQAGNMLPDQVKVQVTDIATGRLRLPVMVQTLKLDAERNCGDPANAGCTMAAAGAITAAILSQQQPADAQSGAGQGQQQGQTQ